MLDNVKNILSQPEIQMLFSENPDVHVKKQVQIRTQRPQITLKHICLFLSFFQTENLLHSVIEHQLPGNLEERLIRKLSLLIESHTAPTYKNLIDFLTAELATMEALPTNGSFNAKSKSGGSKQQCLVAKQNQRQVKKQNYKPTSAHALVARGVSKISPVNVCFLCSQQHCISVCPEFSKLSPAQRLTELISRPEKVCFKCLRGRTGENHRSTFCKCRLLLNVKSLVVISHAISCCM